MLEGRRLAQRLCLAGIPVQFGTDAAVFSFLSQVSLVLIGADSVTRGGVVNKLGTTGVALAARATSVPSYVVCDRQKWLPPAAPLPQGSQLRPSEEVWADAPRGVNVWNAYFECTPLELFSGVITEEGTLPPEEVMSRLAAMPVARALTA